MNEKVCHAYDTPSIIITFSSISHNFPKFGRKNVENVWKFGRKSVTLQPKYSFKDI